MLKSKRQILEKYTYDCQIGMYFTGIKYLKNGFVVYSNIVESPSWNFYTGFHAKTIEEFVDGIREAKNFFKKINREFVLLISPCNIISKKVLNYIKENYDNFENNVVLFTKKFKINKKLNYNYSFRKIDNDCEKDLFVNTFITSKSQTRKDDTYPALPNYFFKALEQSFKNKTDWKFYNYISEYKGKPIGMISACIKGKYCGLYGGGTYIKYSGNGVFSNLLKFIENDLKKENVKYYFGLTEKGSKNERFYNFINFKSLYIDKYFKERK